MFSGVTPTTEVEAVNRIISSIGELPVSSIDGNQRNGDVRAAHQKLREKLRSVQLKGWTFNTDLSFLLTRDPVAGLINLPDNVVRAKPAYEKRHVQGDIKWTIRNQRLYDYRKSTNVWTQDVYADLVRLLPFEALPEPVRHYITITAGREFQAGYLGSDTYHQFTAEQEAEALIGLMDFEVDDGEHNFLNESEAVVEIWRRDV